MFFLFVTFYIKGKHSTICGMVYYPNKFKIIYFFVGANFLVIDKNQLTKMHQIKFQRQFTSYIM